MQQLLLSEVRLQDVRPAPGHGEATSPHAQDLSVAERLARSARHRIVSRWLFLGLFWLRVFIEIYTEIDTTTGTLRATMCAGCRLRIPELDLNIPRVNAFLFYSQNLIRVIFFEEILDFEIQITFLL